MKRLILIATLLLSSLAHAGPHSIVFTQKNAADTGNVLKTPQQPPVDAIVFFNTATNLPDYLTIGPGLVASGGVLQASVPNGPVGPQGPKGDKGDTVIGPPGSDGAPGANGTDGRSAYQIAMANGYYGNESQWLLSLKGADGAAGTNGANGAAGAQGAAGADGKSAYQLAQLNGYTGTLQAWLASLVGATGPQGVQGVQGIQGAPGTPAPTFNFGLPVARTLALTTPYQATNPAKPAIVTVAPSCTASLTLSGGSTCAMQARIGAAPLTCTNGTVVATWTNGNTGALSVGLALNQTVGAPYGINLPTGASFILCPTSGTFTVTAAEQSAG